MSQRKDRSRGKDEMDIEERLQLAKQLRDKEKTILSGKSLAEELEDEDTLSWVNKSRQIQQKRQEQKKNRPKKPMSNKLNNNTNYRNQVEELDQQFSSYDTSTFLIHFYIFLISN